MSLLTIPPCKELKGFVHHFWVASWEEQDQYTPATYYATASSLTEIVFAFRGSQKHAELAFSSVQGQTSLPGQYPAGGFFSMFGISLYPHAIPAFFNLPASELNDQFLDPDILWGKQGDSITEKIALAASTHERIRIISDYFLSGLSRQRFDDSCALRAADHIRLSKGNVSIARLADDFCLSQKQFERRFRIYTGFTPKLYARIVRFENILNNYKAFTHLTEAAHAFGYYDQAHFIHDFKSFSGYSPARFFELSGY